MWLRASRLAKKLSFGPVRRVGVDGDMHGAHMIWTVLALLSPAACADSGSTSPDLKPPVAASAVVVTLDTPILAIGSEAHARARIVDRGGATIRGLKVRWTVLEGSQFVRIDDRGTLVARASGRAVIAASADSVVGTVPIDVVPTFDGQRPDRQKGRAGTPALPRVLLDFPYPAVTGRSIKVDAGDNLQSALNSARRGDEIVLASGAQFTGNFKLPALGGTAVDGWITIRGDKSDRLPLLGTRVAPADGILMPVVITPNTGPAFRLEAGASGWRMVGLEVTVAPTVTQVHYGLIYLGESGKAQSTLESVPSDLVLDRMYIHAQATTNITRCVALNSARTQISDSYLTECHAKGYDSQAIWGGNGPGPYKIVNNTLEGAGENIMFGGYDPAIPGLVPSDIEIRRNYVHTPIAWKGTWTRKNLLEFKNASRVLIEANVFDGSWGDAQTGWAIILKSANQSGACRWCRTTDVTFRRNLIRNAGAGINIAAKGDNPNVDTTARRILITESVMDNLGAAPYTGDRRGLQLLGSMSEITIERTIISGSLDAVMMLDNRGPTTQSAFRDNVWSLGRYGVMASGTAAGTASLNKGLPGAIWERMILVGPQRTAYPLGTGFVSDERDAATAGRVRAIVDSATAGVVR